MRTTVSIDDDLLELAKRRAHEQHLSLGDYLGRAIRVELTLPASTVAPELPTFPGSLRPGLDATKNPWHWEDDVHGWTRPGSSGSVREFR